MFQIDLRSRTSIYEQVIDHLKELIMTDVLEEDSRLPSVRSLSRDLRVNPNTIQKAYRELEREGYVYSVTGKGTFVSSKDGITPDQSKLTEIREALVSAYKSLLYLGLNPDQAEEFADRVISEQRELTGRQTK